MWIGIAIVVVGVFVFLWQLAGLPEKAVNEVAAARQQAVREAEQAGYAAERYRQIALQRMRDGAKPVGNEFERQLAIDGMGMRFQLAGTAMPDTLRELFSYLTLDELQAMARETA